MLRKYQLTSCAIGALALALVACGQAAAPGESVTSEEPAPSAEAPAGTTDPNAQYCAEVSRRISPEDCETFGRLADEASEGIAAFNAPNPMQRGEAHTLQLAISFAPTPEEIAAAEEAARLQRERDEALARAEQEQARLEAERRAQELDNAPRTSTTAPSTGATGVEPNAPAAPPPPAPPPPPPPPTPSETVDPLQGETQEFTPLVGRFMRAELLGDGFEVTSLSPASQEVLEDSVTTWNWRVVAEEGGLRNLTLRTTVEGCTAEGQCYPLRSTTQNYEVEVVVGWSGRIQDFLGTLPDWIKLVSGVLVALAGLVAAWFGLRNAFRKGRE
ncbi:MAG: hypothetical protein AB7O98_13925 [Hyphomonadaceae bacterium]